MDTGPSRRHRALIASLSLIAALTLAGCVGTGVPDYEGWRSAVEDGQSCAELHDIRSNLPDSVDRAQVDADLKDIGCDSPQATRTDR